MSFLNFTKVSEPPTPSSNTTEIYRDTVDNRMKAKNDLGIIDILSDTGMKSRPNPITNGGFIIQQRVATASTVIAGISTTTRGGVVADCWSITSSVASNLNWAQIDTAGAPETNLESRYYGSIISATAGKKVMLSQWVLNSDMAHLRGKNVRVSIKHNQKVGSPQTFKLGLIYLTSSGTVDTSPAFLSGAWSTSTGTDPAFGTNLLPCTPDSTITAENGTVTGNYVNVVTVSNTWVKSSGVFSVPSNAKNLVFIFFADATGGTTDNISLAEAQITIGDEIIDYVEPPLGETLVRCQRRFCKSFPLTVVPAASLAVATGGNGCISTITRAGATALASYIFIQFPIKMWKTPTLTLFGVTGAGAVPWRISGAASAAQTANATTGLLDTGAVISSTGDAAGVVGDLVAVHYTADAEIVA